MVPLDKLQEAKTWGVFPLQHVLDFSMALYCPPVVLLFTAAPPPAVITSLTTFHCGAFQHSSNAFALCFFFFFFCCFRFGFVHSAAVNCETDSSAQQFNMVQWAIWATLEMLLLAKFSCRKPWVGESLCVELTASPRVCVLPDFRHVKVLRSPTLPHANQW